MSFTGDSNEVTSAYKGFARDWTCLGFQYEIGQTYACKGPIEASENGFHACGHPLDVFSYYAPADSVFAKVEQRGPFDRRARKAASTKITILAEVSIQDMVADAIAYVFDRPDRGKEDSAATGKYDAMSAAASYGAATVTGGYGASLATGYGGAALTTGDHGAASAKGDDGAASVTSDYSAALATGERSAAVATGARSAALATGCGGAASATGERSAALATGCGGAASSTGGHGAASATSARGAASATGYGGAASTPGRGGAASATGVYGAASVTGDNGAAAAAGERGVASATGKHSVATACGFQCSAQGSIGSALFLVERADDGCIIHVAALVVGRDGIKPHTLYHLVDGAPVETAKYR